MEQMTNEYRVLLHLLKNSFCRQIPPLSEDLCRAVDWNAVLHEASQQAVLLSVFDRAAAYKDYIPEDVYAHWFGKVSRSLMRNLQISKGQQNLVALLGKHGVSYVILKGEASAAYYTRPDLRHLGDIDFLIKPDQTERVTDLLLTDGYVKSDHVDVWHILFTKARVAFEMHFALPGMPEGPAGEWIRKATSELWNGIERQSSIGGGFSAPSDWHHGLILLLHMQQHMLNDGLGLRHLCDWAAFVNKTHGRDFWPEQLLPLLKEVGLLKYAAVMTRICAEYLGISCPAWAEAERSLCDAVLYDILTGGNFGRKDLARSKAGVIIDTAGEMNADQNVLLRFWDILHRSTYDMYPAAQRSRCLHYALDLYRIGLYLCRWITGKRPSLQKLTSLAEERSSIYEQLQIFET